MTAATDRPLPADRRLLWVILILAAALRLAAVDPFGMHHPDELFQYIEQAHRLATGKAIIPWEYRLGMRSWLVPIILSAPMRLGAWIDPAGNLDLLLPRYLVALIGVVPIWAAWRIGARISHGAAIMAAFVMATWFEAIGFSAHVLTEPMAAAAFMAGVALAEPRARAARWRWAGAAFALAVVLRFHYAPAIGLYAALIAGRNRANWLGLAIGALALGIASGIIDLAMGQSPFGWVVENVRQNIINHRAADFGVTGPGAFLGMLAHQWGVLGAAIIVMAIVGAVRFPALAAAAIVNLGLHSLIAHKEYRFVWISVETILLLAAIGSALSAARLAARRPGDQRLIWGVTALLWLVASIGLGQTRPMEQDRAHDRPVIALARAAGALPGLCGLALNDVEYWAAGYAMVRKPAPIYYPSAVDPHDTDALTRWRGAYNVILSPARQASMIPTGYASTACLGSGDGKACLYRRPGSCDATGAEPILLQRLLERRGL